MDCVVVDDVDDVVVESVWLLMFAFMCVCVLVVSMLMFVVSFGYSIFCGCVFATYFLYC